MMQKTCAIKQKMSIFKVVDVNRIKPNQKQIMESKTMKHQSITNKSLLMGAVVVTAFMAFVPEVFASGGISEFSGPFEKVMETITGPWGRIVSIAGMAICGVVFIFNRQDMGEGFKMMLQVVFGICFICFAATIVDALFGGFGGAVI